MFKLKIMEILSIHKLTLAFNNFANMIFLIILKIKFAHKTLSCTKINFKSA